jgi:hypothetical protein
MTNTNTQQNQQQSQAPIQSYFEKEHNDNDNGGNKDKYPYNSYNSCESNKNIFDLRYEDLRKKAMKMEIEGKNANTPGIQELSIFIQRGMIDWVEAWNKCQLNEMTNSQKIKALVYNNKERQLDTDTDTDTDKDYAGINLPLNLQAQLKNLLVQIVMSTLPNKMSAKPITQRGDW